MAKETENNQTNGNDCILMMEAEKENGKKGNQKNNSGRKEEGIGMNDLSKETMIKKKERKRKSCERLKKESEGKMNE